MSLPTFPPSSSITREDATNQIISSIAMEEVALSHILNAEGEKIQYVLGTLEGAQPLPEPVTIQNLLDINQSVRETMDSALQSQMFLKNKLATILSSSQNGGDTPVGTNGFIIPFASGVTTDLSTTTGGTPNSLSTISFGATNTYENLTSIDPLLFPVREAFILPANITITELWASFILFNGPSPINTNCEVFTQLYYSNANENNYTAIPETLNLLGSIPQGTVPDAMFTITNSISNLSVQLPIGSKVFLGVFLESVLPISIEGVVNAGIAATRRS